MTVRGVQLGMALTVVLGGGACSAYELAAPDARIDVDAGTRLHEPCVMLHIYQVEEDMLTFQVGQEWQVDRQWRGEFEYGLTVPGDWDGVEPILTGRLALHHRDGGRAELWWGERVLVTPIEPSYYTSRQTDIRSWQSPTGVQAELHLLSRATCYTPPAHPLTRDEVDALEE